MVVLGAPQGGINKMQHICFAFLKAFKMYKAMPTAIQIKFTRLLKWISQIVPETFNARTLSPSVPTVLETMKLASRSFF